MTDYSQFTQEAKNEMLRVIAWEAIFGSASEEFVDTTVRALLDAGAVLERNNDEMTYGLPKQPRLISFCGPMGSGKTLAAEYMRDRYGFELLHFASPIKELACNVTPDNRIDKVRDRELLQFFATYLRKHNPDLTIDAWAPQADGLLVAGKSVATDDCRYGNEAMATRARGGLVVRIEAHWSLRQRRLRNRDGGLPNCDPEHESEKRGSWHDVEIWNDGSRETLYAALDHLMQSECRAIPCA